MEHMLHPTNQIDIRAWLMQKSEIRGFPKPVFLNAIIPEIISPD